jgi:exodeoxyribonuclease V alpha subunit
MNDLAHDFAQLLPSLQLVHLDSDHQATYSAVGLALWRALEAGHTALSDSALHTQLGDAADLIDLRTSAAVLPAPDNLGPIIYERGFWYLQRYARIEARLALALFEKNRISSPAGPVDPLLLAPLNQQQRQALSMGLARQLLVLSGGPGTGKTFTLARLLQGLRSTVSGQRLLIAGSAPTGKAASRLEQSCEGLDWSGTVHRLLQQRRNAANKLAFDVVIVDEATMLDTQLADQLLQALDSSTRLILAGDHNQLSSVLSGAFFAQACELQEATCYLVQSRRFAPDSPIAKLAGAINQGAVASQPDEYVGAGVEFFTETKIGSWQQWVLGGYANLINALGQDQFDSGLIIGALNRFRVLCATHDGAFGVLRTNQFMSRWVSGQGLAKNGVGQKDQSGWFVGRVVMMTKNDSVLQLNNGDTGVCVLHDGQLQVLFEMGSMLPVSNLIHVTEAWAITVHKSQGSEYDEVLIPIAPVSSPQARRELLYTAVTRAKRQVKLVGQWSDLVATAHNRAERFSGLAARLQALCRP